MNYDRKVNIIDISESMTKYKRRNYRFNKALLWEQYTLMNNIKLHLYLINCVSSSGGWQRKLASFVLKSWSYESQCLDWSSTCLVYCVLRPFSRGEYIGETSIGYVKRMKSHIQSTLNNKNVQSFHRVMQYWGPHNYIFFPIFMFKKPVSKFQRLQKEGAYIMSRNPSLNTLGKKDFKTSGKVYTTMVWGKRKKRFRPFKRLRLKASD